MCYASRVLCWNRAHSAGGQDERGSVVIILAAAVLLAVDAITRTTPASDLFLRHD